MAQMLRFYLRPDVWGSGSAMALMTETCSKLSEDYGEAHLWALRDATRAHRFYEKAGFRATGAHRIESQTDWMTPEIVMRPAVQYRKTLTP